MGSELRQTEKALTLVGDKVTVCVSQEWGVLLKIIPPRVCGWGERSPCVTVKRTISEKISTEGA